MTNLTKEQKALISLAKRENKDGTLAIRSSSKMHEFCRDSAVKIANFYREDYYPLTIAELKPFLKQITKEFKNIFKA